MLHNTRSVGAPRAAPSSQRCSLVAASVPCRSRAVRVSARQHQQHETALLQPLPGFHTMTNSSRHGGDVRCAAVSRVLMKETPAVAAAASTATATTTSTATPTQQQAQPQQTTLPELTPESFTAFLDTESVCVVDFYTDWCGPCRIMDKELETLTRCFPTFKFARINCGREEHQAFSTAQRVRSLPTIRIYKNKVQLEQVTGARPVQLRQSLSHYFALYSRRT